MSFSSFSKDFAESSFTNVENSFITKYLPEANGDAVRVYLYGLYLCGCSQEFDAESAAKLLKLPLKKVVEIYTFWEECGLVQILSREPLFVEYLPVSAAIGKPKPIRPEKYAEFNRELYKLLQKAGKDFRPFELQRILEFLENNPMEQQAFLLVAEYCVKKDGARLSSSHILNKAEKLVREHKYTYEQVEGDLADYNAHEKELSRIFTLLGIYRKPQDGDYLLLEKWTAAGFETGAAYACAETLKKGSMATLDALISELCEKKIFSEADAREYLERREELADIVFKVGRKLGVKVQNPRPYIEEYAEKWSERGYDGESLVLVASIGLRLSYGFSELDALLEEMYRLGIVDGDGVRAYCADRDRQLRLLQSIQSVCGVVKKSQATLDMLGVWRSWNFGDEMILEAAHRSANAASPIPYMNKLLSEWKRLGVFTPDAIPEAQTPIKQSAPSAVKSEAAIAADARSERERYYAVRRERAMRHAERAIAIAEKDEEYRAAEAARKKGEIELAKAEMYSPETAEALKAELSEALARRSRALARLHLTERDFEPRFECVKCSDTGFLPNGQACDCYRK